MAFRDDREAQALRVAELERALAEARQDADELARTKAELAATTAERDALRAGQGPEISRVRNLGLSMLVAVTAVAAGGMFVERLNDAEERAACEREIAERSSQLAAAQRDRDDATTELAEARAAAEQRAVTPPAPVEPPAVQHVVRRGTVSALSGHAPTRMGATCDVVVDYEPWASDCRATVECGPVGLYPQRGQGFFGCTVAGGRIIEGADTNPTSSSNDPRLVYSDLRVIVSDEAPDWSVAIDLVPSVTGDPI